MENAAKAIIMAGVMLVAILMLSLFIFLIKSMGGSTADMYSIMDESQITSFNQKFLNYDNKTDLKPQEVVTIINLARESNEKKKINKEDIIIRMMTDAQYQTFVAQRDEAHGGNSNWDNSSWWVQDNNVDEVIERLNNDVLSEKTYTCQVLRNVSTKLVSSVNIIENAPAEPTPP